MTIDSLRALHLPSTDYGDVYVSPVSMAEDGRWGVLEPIRETVWGKLIPVVTGDAMALAKHGYVKPLMEMIGRPPLAQLHLIPHPHRVCADHKTCASFRAEHCHPGPKLPDCYTPPELPPDVANVARLVALAWREGFHVVVVNGPEFVA